MKLKAALVSADTRSEDCSGKMQLCVDFFVFHINFSTRKNSWILSIVFMHLSPKGPHYHISIADNREIFIKLSCVIQREQMCRHISSCMPVFSFKERR